MAHIKKQRHKYGIFWKIQTRFLPKCLWLIHYSLSFHLCSLSFLKSRLIEVKYYFGFYHPNYSDWRQLPQIQSWVKDRKPKPQTQAKEQQQQQKDLHKDKEQSSPLTKTLNSLLSAENWADSATRSTSYFALGLPTPPFLHPPGHNTGVGNVYIDVAQQDLPLDRIIVILMTMLISS